MSAQYKQFDQIDAARQLLHAFGIKGPANEAASSVFPARVVEDTQQNVSEVNNYMARIKQQRDASHMSRILQTEITKLREDELQRPDSSLKFLFHARKNRFYYSKQGMVKQPSSESLHTAGSVDPPSPFLRRAVSRDPIHKIKEEIVSPSPLSSVNGMARSRSRNRAQSMMTGQSLTPIKSSLSIQSTPENQFQQNSIEKTSVSNPLYLNMNGTPVRPGMRTKDEPVRSHTTLSMRHPKPPPYPGKPIDVRIGTPPVVSNESFCRELRGALQGICGVYFVNDGRGHVVVSQTCSINESMQTAVQDILLLGNTYYEIRRAVKRYADGSMVREAVIGAIEIVLEQYLVDIGDLPVKITGKAGVQLILFRARPWIFRLDALRRCVEALREPTLLLQEEIYTLWLAARDTEAEEIMTTVLNAALGVFCNALRSWINCGELIDDRWIIQEDSSDFGYRIDYQPCFASGISIENVLKIGTSRVLIAEKEVEQLDQFRELVEAHAVPDNLFLPEGRAKINETVSEMTKWIGRKVVDRLMKEGYLMEYLSAARRYLLLDDTPFSLALHKCIKKSTERELGLTRDQAFTAFVAAVKQSPAAKSFPFKVTIDTLVSRDSSSVSSARSQFINSIHPLLTVSGMSEKIFRHTQASYETLFHFLWSLQTALFNTEDVALRLRLTKREAGRSSESGQLHRMMSAACSRLLRLFLAVRQYTLVAISQSSGRFHARLNEVSDVESTARQHQLYLEELQALLFCNEEGEKIATLISKTVQLAYTLSKESIRFEKEVECSVNSDQPEASESVIEFERAEKSISLAPIKRELLGMSRTFKTIMTELQSQLVETREHTPLTSIILRSFVVQPF